MYNGERICRARTADRGETRALMMQSIAESEKSGQVFKATNMTLSELLDIWLRVRKRCFKAWDKM